MKNIFVVMVSCIMILFIIWHRTLYFKTNIILFITKVVYEFILFSWTSLGDRAICHIRIQQCQIYKNQSEFSQEGGFLPTSDNITHSN